jgi:hypothetical protein
MQKKVFTLPSYILPPVVCFISASISREYPSADGLGH